MESNTFNFTKQSRLVLTIIIFLAILSNGFLNSCRNEKVKEVPDGTSAEIPYDTIDFEPYSTDALYSFYERENVLDSGSVNWYNARNEYVKRCENGGIDFVSMEFSKHPYEMILSDFVDKMLIHNLYYIDFDSLYNIAPYYKHTQFSDTIGKTLTTIAEGPLQVSKAYSLGMDSCMEDIITDLVIENMPRLSLSEQKEIVPYYKNTSRFDDVSDEYILNIQKELDDARMEFEIDVDDLLSMSYDVMRQNIHNISETVFSNSNYLSRLIKKKSDDRKRKFFLDEWNKQFQKERYKNFYTSSVNSCYSSYIIKRNKILKDLDLIKNDYPKLNTRIELKPDVTIFLNTHKALILRQPLASFLGFFYMNKKAAMLYATDLFFDYGIPNESKNELVDYYNKKVPDKWKNNVSKASKWITDNTPDGQKNFFIECELEYLEKQIKTSFITNISLQLDKENEELINKIRSEL